MSQLVTQHQYIILDAMEALEKPCELLQVISEGYDLILSHCMTIGLNYIIWHTQHESFSVLLSELCCLLYVRVCVCVL